MQTGIILVLYYSRHGATANMARIIARSIDGIAGTQANLRTVPKIPASSKRHVENTVPDSGPAYATLEDLKKCDGMLVGSPTHFGNMAAPLKHFFDQTTPIWISGALAGKPAAVFTSTGGIHSGQETTLLSMMLPLLHHGMVICGIPYTEAQLSITRTGGAPYGATHYAGNTPNRPVDEDESALCSALGRRVATLALRLR